MFDNLKQVNELLSKAKEFQALAAEFSHLDADHNGKLDLQEHLAKLAELKDLVEKEGSEVKEEVEEARDAIGEKLREILRLGVLDAEVMRAKLSAPKK